MIKSCPYCDSDHCPSCHGKGIVAYHVCPKCKGVGFDKVDSWMLRLYDWIVLAVNNLYNNYRTDGKKS